MKKFRLRLNTSVITDAFAYFVYTFRNIVWPSPKMLLVYTLVVLVISAIISAYLIGADSLFGAIRNQLLFK